MGVLPSYCIAKRQRGLVESPIAQELALLSGRLRR